MGTDMTFRSQHISGRAFTLIEVMVSITVLVLLMGILFSITNQTQALWKNTQGKVETFRAGRNGFESINRHLRQATLNTYWDYDSVINPTIYQRRSELRFISGPASQLGLNATCYTHAIFFQGPFGYSSVTSGNTPLPAALNTWGCYVALTDGTAALPTFLKAVTPARWRLRLYEMIEPSTNLTLYTVTSGNATTTSPAWFQTPLATAAYSHELAENVIAVIFRPKQSTASGTVTAADLTAQVSLAPDYIYDSSGGLSGSAASVQTAQLPPMVQVTVVAMAEASAVRFSQAQLQAIATKADGYFTNSASSMESNLASLQTYLDGQHINYKIFTSNVNISGSKWSK